jgi:hypothetical protein
VWPYPKSSGGVDILVGDSALSGQLHLEQSKDPSEFGLCDTAFLPQCKSEINIKDIKFSGTRPWFFLCESVLFTK